MKPTTIRVTSLDLYESCPYCFYLSVNGVKQQANKNLLLGTQVHQGIENYHRGKGKGIMIVRDAIPFVKEYTKRYNPDFQEAEYKFALPLPNSDITLTGTIDLIKDDWIFEHKTSSTYYTQARVDAHHQVTAYSWAYRKLFKKSERGIRFNILIKNKAPLLQILDTFRTDADYIEWLNWVHNVLDNIAANKFSPKAGRFHNYSQCPASHNQQLTT